MKNIFNNPIFIAVLGFLAFAMLLWTVAKPFMNKPKFSNSDDDTEDWMDISEKEKPVVIGNIELQAVSIEKLYWDKQPKRDPFSRDIVIKAKDVKKVESQVKVKSNDIKYRRPVLSALVAGEQSRFAVIDGQIVQEGDRVAGMSVNKISEEGVWLASDKVSYKLTLSANIGN